MAPKKITARGLFELRDKWKTYMSDSWDRAEEMINFVEGEAQKEEGANDIKHEKCSFNVLIALLGTLQSRAKTIELTLSMIGDCKDEKELKTFQNLLNSIMLNNENVNSISKSLDKIYSCGQAILQVKQKREDNKTLNKVIDIENIEDITSAFFDTCSIDENFNNGRYCGRYYEIEPNVLKKHYK
jgi:flagellin-specific chaperone FliS